MISLIFDFEYAYNEGWNAYHQIDALNGNLYKNYSAYVYANYTPLSFFVAGYFSKFGDDVIIIGRSISTISFSVIVLIVGLIAKRLSASGRESLFAAVMCIGLLGAYHRIYVSIDDPQLLGSAVSLIGLFIYVNGRVGFGQNTIILGVLIIAGLIKPTLFTIPIVIAVDLVLRDRRWRIKFIGEGILRV